MVRVPLPLLVATLAAAFACSSGKTDHAPLVSSGPSCDPPLCQPSVPAAAFAVELRPLADGGTCSDPAVHGSLPEGDAAFQAILTCGGNKVRCGDADYRVTAGAGATVTCTVAAGAAYHVSGQATGPGAATATVEGNLRPDGGTVTVSASFGRDGGALPMNDCPASVRFLRPGSVYADFTCPGSAGCVYRGTLVFEDCSLE